MEALASPQCFLRSHWALASSWRWEEILETTGLFLTISAWKVPVSMVKSTYIILPKAI